jgi:hypothetical protein
MARGKSVAIDLDEAHRLKAHGASTAEIARQLKLPVSTLKDQLKRALPAKATDVYTRGPTEVQSFQISQHTSPLASSWNCSTAYRRWACRSGSSKPHGKETGPVH